MCQFLAEYIFIYGWEGQYLNTCCGFRKCMCEFSWITKQSRNWTFDRKISTQSEGRRIISQSLYSGSSEYSIIVINVVLQCIKKQHVFISTGIFIFNSFGGGAEKAQSLQRVGQGLDFRRILIGFLTQERGFCLPAEHPGN